MLGGSTGINVCGAIRLARELGPGQTIVTILADSGTPLSVEAVQPGIPEGATRPADPALAGKSVEPGTRSYDRAALFRDDRAMLRVLRRARVVAADERGIRLDRTVFYPTGGGQPGDTGMLRLASGRDDRDRRHGQGRRPGRGHPRPGAGLGAARSRAPSSPPRSIGSGGYRLMRMHTCLHLLCARRAGRGDRRPGVGRHGPARFRRARSRASTRRRSRRGSTR